MPPPTFNLDTLKWSTSLNTEQINSGAPPLMCSSSKDLESVVFKFQKIKLSVCQVCRLDFDADVSHQGQRFTVPILHDPVDGIEGRRDLQQL